MFNTFQRVGGSVSQFTGMKSTYGMVRIKRMWNGLVLLSVLIDKRVDNYQ